MIHVIKKGKNHDSCRVIEESNNFGDQVLVYIYETIHGGQKKITETNEEGNFISKEQIETNAKEHFKDIWHL
jgi:hypothetical protein